MVYRCSSKFEEWYANEITKQVDKGEDVYAVDVDTKLSMLKLVHAQWLISSYDHLHNKPVIVKRGFQL